MNAELASRLAHAKSYPFPIPGESFLFVDGRVEPLDGRAVDRAGRVPVLAAGSNQSPEQLARKYRGHGPGVTIPAERGRLHDFDVVYAAHVAAYGSITATFQHSPGTAVSVFVLWLDAAQLARMHETEGNYTYDRLWDVSVALDQGGRLAEAFAYSARAGCLSHAGKCVGVAEIAAERRRFPAATQPEIQSLARDRLDPGAALDAFIAAPLLDPAVQHHRTAMLKRDALAIAYRREILATF